MNYNSDKIIRSKLKREDELFHYSLWNSQFSQNPKDYKESLSGFYREKKSSHSLGNRVRYLHGKAAYLLSMVEFDTKKSKEELKSNIIPNIKAYDLLTQFYIIGKILDLKLYESWDTLRDLYNDSIWWRNQRFALEVLVKFSEQKKWSPL